MLADPPLSPSAHRPVWLLNAPIITQEGRYEMRRTSLRSARRLVRTHGCESAIGHAATASLVADLLGVDCPMHRREYQQAPGEHALVLRLNRRLPEGRVLATRADLDEVGYSFWLLHRTA